ncbi:MAG: hypothetical protein PHF31_17380, partial [Methylobacter sp.]|nr:hypothetical protein [Methylobacter sp.]
AFNACIGARLKGPGKYPKPPVGMGGQNDKRIQSAFTAAVQACRGTRSPRAKSAAAAANYDY